MSSEQILSNARIVTAEREFLGSLLLRDGLIAAVDEGASHLPQAQDLGGDYLLPGLVEANESSVAVLGITSDVSVGARGKFPLTELDQQALYKPLTKWNTTIDRVDQIPHAVRSAFRAMTTGRPGAAHICLPYDVQKHAIDESEVWAQPGHDHFPAYRSAPDPASVDEAAERLVAARSPVLICGGGVVIAGASAALDALATLLNAPVCTSVSGKRWPAR